MLGCFRNSEEIDVDLTREPVEAETVKEVVGCVSHDE